MTLRSMIMIVGVSVLSAANAIAGDCGFLKEIP